MSETEPRSPPRAMRPDGTANVLRRGVERHLAIRDVYHALRTRPWRVLLGGVAAAWTLVNLLFAALYLVGGPNIAGARPGSFADAFFFSVQTLSTIGYGAMSPTTTYANALVAVEALLGLLMTAVTTGLVFAKFATPTARVTFARNALINRHDGRPVLTFRMANQRANTIVEANLRVTLLRDEVTAEGEAMRRFHDLRLVRQSTPIFTLGWTAYHVIDADSPLWQQTREDLRRTGATLLVVLSGTDSTLSESIHARHAYDWSDLLWDRRYVDTVSVLPDGSRVVDYTHFHDTEPAPDEKSSPA